MALIGMRELLRSPKQAFDKVDDGEVCLVTRNGQPVAALVPIDEANAERFILAAAPRFEEDRRKAEHARAEGQTTSIEDVARRFGVDDPDAAQGETIELAAAYDVSDAVVRRLDGSLFHEFASAAAPADEAAEAPAIEDAYGRAMEEVTEFKGDATKLITRVYGSDASPFRAAYMIGGIVAIERVRRLQGGEGQDASAWVERMLGSAETIPE